MKPFALAVAVVFFAILGGLTISADDDPSLVTVRCPSVQGGDELYKQWEELPRPIRKRIGSALVSGRLGLSSTGAVQLIGVYNQVKGGGEKARSERLFHFRHADLFGTRLFWSVLVNIDNETYRILFHIDGVSDRDTSWLKLPDG